MILVQCGTLWSPFLYPGSVLEKVVYLSFGTISLSGLSANAFVYAPRDSGLVIREKE